MDELQNRFQSIYPKAFFLSPSKEDLTSYLQARKWLKENAIIQSLEKPGEGNMNCVLRITTNKGSFIIKQARPWVEKYPQIDAPVERNGVEADYFSIVNERPELRNYSPELLGVDRDNFILLVSDLGQGADFSYLYQKDASLKPSELKAIIDYLSHLHALECNTFPENRAMRELNHFHIFSFPFMEDNEFNLDDIQSGLQAISLPFKQNEALKTKINQLGGLYLQKGTTLIHGDYYPGSWLQTKTGLKVIDPEFSFLGFAEFDIGVLIAHLLMAQQGKEMVENVLALYTSSNPVNEQVLAGIAGTEILRRLFGVAQLPLSLSLEEKNNLAQLASKWILEGEIHF